MARVFLSTGLCPSCGRDVGRTVHVQAGIQTEVLHCPTHGRLETTIGKTPLWEWAARRAALA